MYKKKSKSNVIAINLTPLINVVFLLLLFFIVAGKLNNNDDGDISLPVSSSEKIVENEVIDIVIDADANVFISDYPISFQDIKNALSLLLINNSDKVITIKADNNVSGIRLIDIMNEIESAGGKNIALMSKSR